MLTHLANLASSATVLGTGAFRSSSKDLTYQFLTSWIDGISRITGLSHRQADTGQRGQLGMAWRME